MVLPVHAYVTYLNLVSTSLQLCATRYPVTCLYVENRDYKRTIHDRLVDDRKRLCIQA